MPSEAEVWSRFPQRPPHIAEWEDLLIRFEVGPQAVRHLLDDAALAPGSTDAASAVTGLLTTWVDAEAILATRLWTMRTGEAPPPSATAPPADSPDHPAALLDRFARLRMRNFVMVQRRGLDVWDWKWSGSGMPDVSAFQLLGAAALRDVRQLELLRRALRECASC